MAVKQESNLQPAVVRERQPRLIMKRYEYILNEELASLSHEQALAMFKGSLATDDEVCRATNEGRLGVLMMQKHEKQFIKRFIKWVEAEEKKEKR